uniref:Uncharacterized protein n=1 Tax=Rhizophora mucronata TaxID=61149 RepID=A0A2P2N3C3_RHIMU
MCTRLVFHMLHVHIFFFHHTKTATPSARSLRLSQHAYYQTNREPSAILIKLPLYTYSLDTITVTRPMVHSSVPPCFFRHSDSYDEKSSDREVIEIQSR